MSNGAALHTSRNPEYMRRIFKKKIFEVADVAWTCSADNAEKKDVTSMFSALYTGRGLETWVPDLGKLDVREHLRFYRRYYSKCLSFTSGLVMLRCVHCTTAEVYRMYLHIFFLFWENTPQLLMKYRSPLWIKTGICGRWALTAMSKHFSNRRMQLPCRWSKNSLPHGGLSINSGWLIRKFFYE